MASGRPRGTPAGTKPRARPQLDVATIMEAALRLTTGRNPAPLTVRSLGKELGADPTAIYRHFRDKDELVRAVLDQLLGQAVEAVDPATDWRSRLTQLSRATLEILGEHPSIGAVAGSQTTGGEGELAAIEMIIVAMNEAGLDRADAVRFYGVVSSYVVSFTAAQCGALVTGEPDTNPNWIGVTRSLERTRHPAVTAVRDELEALRDRDIYESGVQVILDAIASRAELSRT